ncbi:RING finger protein nhl-1-like isoform X2 [Oppia nitens]|uniref:RING finger protein nhl-1-like isoform X2 n=1 Tax=Oppia nitens TaxID=1686743 RepID=UPI0023DCC8A4|nr:RING finger protein nhl-1-like isoform X2 [Oppia nitens]
MTSAWSQLEQLLTCCVCLDRFRNPKLLPCQHTFCGEPCLEGLVDYARRQIKCPECRAEHRIPYNGVQSFPNNVTLARFLDLHRDITGEEPEPLPSQMDRCGVCSEKAFCEKCSHCDKKVCEECKVAHLDILKREITRINGQIRRGLTKLTEHSQQSGRTCDKLQTTSRQIRDEITECVRRIIKDLKDKEAKLLHELDEYTQTESKGGEKMKEDLEQELINITSNCELVESHITENEEWTDTELVEYKEILVKTLEFLRNLDPDTSDVNRKIKFHYKSDFDALRRSVIDFGELKITTPNVALSPSESTTNLNSLSVPNQTNLLRSQSDHRLAAQFQSQRKPESRYLDITGSQSRLSMLSHSDTERDSRLERNTSPTRQRYGRYGRDLEDRETRSRYDSALTRGWPRPSDNDEPIGTTTHFRSRFMRERNNQDVSSFEDSHDSDYGSTHRSVRFQEEPNTQPRPKIFDTEEVTRGPLSGVIKLVDSPAVMQRLHQNEVRQKQKEQEAVSAPPPPQPLSTPVSNTTSQTIRRLPSRQVSEDEIEKQKKANQAAAAAQTANPPAPVSATPATQSPKTSVPQSPVTTVPDSPTRIINRRLTQLQKEDSITSRYSSDGSRHGSDIEDNQPGDDSDTGISRYSRRREESPSSRISAVRQTSTQRSIRSPLGKNSSVDRDRHSNTIIAPVVTESPQHNTHLESTTVTNRQPIVSQPSDKTNARIISTDIDSDNSDSNASNESSADSQSESDEEEEDEEEEDEEEDEEEEEEPNTRTAVSVSSSRPLTSISHESAQVRKAQESITKPESPVPQRISRQNTLSDDTTNERPVYKGRRTSDATKDDYTSSYQSRRPLSRAATLDDDPDDVVSTSTPYSRFLSRSKTSSTLVSNDNTGGDDSKFTYNSTTRRPDKFGFDDSDDENVNPISPTYKSRYSESVLPARRTSRSSGYTYRTRDPGSPPAEDDMAQYLINKYSSKTSSAHKTEPTNRTSSILKSKSSHVLFGRSISSSDDEPSIASLSARRRSRDENTASFMSSLTTSGIGLTYPRQMFLQKSRLMMKIGSRGTDPGCFTWPRGVAVGPNNSIVVADSSNHRVQVFDSTGRFSFEFGSYGSGEGEFDCLAGVCVNRIGQFIVSDRYNHRVQVFDSSGRFMRAFGSEGRSDSKFSYPWGIASDALGFIYVCDKENHRIQVFQSDGLFVGKFGTIGSRTGMLEHPHYIAVSNTNRVIISDSNNHRIQIFDVNGRSLTTFGSEGSNDGQFKFPRGVAVDDQGFIIVGDSGNNRIQIFNPDGTFLKSFGTWGAGEGEFKGLEGVAITSTGNILVCDRENHRIQMF